MNEYKQNCPKCNKELYYGDRFTLRTSIDRNCFCHSCGAKKYVRTEEHCKNISKALTGRRSPSSRFTSESVKKGWETRRKNGTDKGFHWKSSNDKKQKLRELRIKQNLETGTWYQLGKHEKQILDEQEKVDNCKIDRNFILLKYHPDGYCYETNTIYEVYEWKHKYKVERDLKRQKEIEEYLKCKFIIIWDNIINTSN